MSSSSQLNNAETTTDATPTPGKRLPTTLWSPFVGDGGPANDPLPDRPAVMQVRLIALRDVIVPEGRTSRQTTLEALKDSIATAGLLQPIVVDSNLRLVCGFHRLEACRALGWEALPVIVQHLEGAHAKLAEIDENLCRHELSALERGEHTALRKRFYQELRAEADRAEPPSSPRPKKGKAKEADPEAIARAFLAETAQRTGRSRAAVAQDVKIGELDADVRTMLHETPLHKKKNELVALTKMPVDEQREAVARVKAGEAKSVRPKRSNDPPTPGPSAPSSLPSHPFAATLLDLREVTTTLERVVDSWPKDDNADYRELTLRLRAALDHLHDVRKRIESFAPSAAAELDRRAGPPREPTAPAHRANQPRQSPAQPGPRRGPGSRQQRKPTE